MTSVLPSAPADAAPGRRGLALLGISLGYFMVLLDTTVLSVAEPDLADSLNGTVAGLQWAVTGYTVVFGALLPSAGALADRYGAHRVFRAGVAAFGAGSLLWQTGLRDGSPTGPPPMTGSGRWWADGPAR
ncbi:MFS transporter, partial [Actinomadura sp. NPDC000929]|uniref:MFS transporter n=1 Tax=Actinomadura sp. NPDC000929 TaxID=3154517 RepID=UPI00339709B1